MQLERATALERPRFKTMLLLGAVLAVLMLGVFGSSSLTAKADAACSGGALCSFTGSHFGSFFNNYSCMSFSVMAFMKPGRPRTTAATTSAWAGMNQVL